MGNASSSQAFFFLSQAARKAVFDRRLHPPLQLPSCENQLSIKGRVFITLWVVSIRGSLSCALKRKED